MKSKAILFTTAFILVMAWKSYSQLQSGTVMVGGRVSANMTTTETRLSSEATSYKFNVSPNLSYFALDNLAVGLITPFIYSLSEANGGKRKITTYSLGPAVRYYFPFDRWSIFPTASFTYGWTREKYKAAGYDDYFDVRHSKRNTFTGGVGITYFATQNVGIEGVVAYVNDRHLEYNGHGSEFVTDHQINFSIGVQVYLYRPR